MTKLAKYRPAASWITVTLDGADGSGRDQRTDTSPILLSVTEYQHRVFAGGTGTRMREIMRNLYADSARRVQWGSNHVHLLVNVRRRLLCTDG